MRALLGAARVAPRSGLLDPRHTWRLLAALRRWDRTLVACLAAHAKSHPGRVFIVDELGELTFAEVDERTNAVANELAALGIAAGDHVGLMCRNHRGFVEAVLACSKLGCTAVLLNTDFAAPQLTDVVERESARALIYDAEFGPLLEGVTAGITRIVAWTDGETTLPTVDELAANGSRHAPAPPPAPGRMVILSAGTTGAPKGVRRRGSTPFLPLFALLERIPLRARETRVICAPIFHGWGFLHLGLALLMGSTVVLRRRFDPEVALALIAEHRAASAPMVPVMLQRIMRLDPEVIAAYDLSSLGSIPLAGSAIPAGLAVQAMDSLGDVVYNIYGSTEVALATAATPRDLREAPGTAGRPLAGTEVQILDACDREQPPGKTGVVFVGCSLAADGYSHGGGKRAVGGMLSSGDLGHFDEQGRLFIDGREDEMIVSGGENVYPGEVEDLLVAHPAIVEAAVVGVEDREFGQRLRAFVVCEPDAQLEEEEVRARVRENLARYKVPRDVTFVEALPRSPAGKVLKRELAAVAFDNHLPEDLGDITMQ